MRYILLNFSPVNVRTYVARDSENFIRCYTENANKTNCMEFV